MRVYWKKMKKWLFMFLVICFVLTPAIASAQSVRVEIPDFQVNVNGVAMENKYNRYPLIVYKDITYFPMAYNYAAFMGLKSNWYPDARGGAALFVGVTEQPLKELIYYTGADANGKYCSAAVSTYKIALNTLLSENFLDNSKEEYPILNFRDITYFPLTWRFAAGEFGWEYAWDESFGLRINTGNPFRPVIDDTWIGNHSPNGTTGRTVYFYGDDYYVGYPGGGAAFYPNFDFIVRKRGGEEKQFSLRGVMPDGYWYFNSQTEDNGYGLIKAAEIKPSIIGNIFSIAAVWQADNKEPQNYLFRLNLDTCEMLGLEPPTHS
jgi:hypothetical protein